MKTTPPPLANVHGILPQHLIIWHFCVRGGDPKETPQLEEPSGHVSALAATQRVKPIFRPILSCIPSVLFPGKFTIRYGFRPASRAKPKAAYCLANLVVQYCRWTGDRKG